MIWGMSSRGGKTTQNAAIFKASATWLGPQCFPHSFSQSCSPHAALQNCPGIGWDSPTCFSPSSIISRKKIIGLKSARCFLDQQWQRGLLMRQQRQRLPRRAHLVRGPPRAHLWDVSVDWASGDANELVFPLFGVVMAQVKSCNEECELTRTYFKII